MGISRCTVLGWLAIVVICLNVLPAQSQKVRTPGETGWSVVQGLPENAVEGEIKSATISGGGLEGFPNIVIGEGGSVGGGAGNRAAELATVAGGYYSNADGLRSAIGGGGYNMADRDSATIAGGYGNRASGNHATISGGTINAALEVNATVGGGSGNTASERHSFIGGGTSNKASGLASVTAGGVYNSSTEAYAAVGGGISNAAKARGSAIAGGAGNVAEGDNATIAGGLNNSVSDNYGTVTGGRANQAGNFNSNPIDARYASVGGGDSNLAAGAYSVVPGGAHNTAAGAFSFAAGRRSRINESCAGAFVYADANDQDFHSETANEFAVRATGGARFVTATDSQGESLGGVRLAGGSGAWESLSDRQAKKDFADVDQQDILEKVASLPLMSWSYATQPSSIRHIGPVAQDFNSIFSLGENERYISTVDADGVSLAAIQALYRRLRDLELKLAAYTEQIRVMETVIRVQQSRIEGLAPH